jgi:hypothetical protein
MQRVASYGTLLFYVAFSVGGWPTFTPLRLL